MAAQKERIILGCMTFGADSAKGGQVTTIEATREITDYFHSKGYNEIDTARVYHDGENEGWMREAGWKEYGFEVATKLYPLKPGTHKPEVIRSSIATSLTELGTSQVDIWYLHAPDRSVPFEETLTEVDKLHKEGKFKILGLSNYTAFEVAEICTLCRERGWVRPRIYQAMYNAITRAIEKELIPACRRYGLDIVVYNPVAGGFFSGKYRSRTPPPPPPPSSATSPSPSPTPTSRFFCANRGAAYRTRYFRDSYFEALDILEPVALKHNITLLEASLRWLVHHSALKMRSEGGNDGIVIGVSRIEQLRENLANLEKGPLPLEVVEALEKAWEVCRGVCPDYWHLKLEYTSQF